AVSTAWDSAGNWQGGVVPDSSSVVAIPPDSLLTGAHNHPVLESNVRVAAIYVGFGSTLTQGLYTLQSAGIVDAVGTISGNTVVMTGTGTYLRGNVGALQVSGSTELQGAVKTTGAVSVTGVLTVKDQAMSISLP